MDSYTNNTIKFFNNRMNKWMEKDREDDRQHRKEILSFHKKITE